MARIVFEVDIAAEAGPIVAALDNERGIASWWTDEVAFAGGVGSTMTLGFPIAPKPFVLRVAQVDPERVRWESIGDFPPHWVGTEIIWTLSTNPEGHCCIWRSLPSMSSTRTLDRPADARD